jgi:L-iditol 2-dehydrogenase
MVKSTSVPSNMQALVLTGPGEFEIQTVPVPEPGPGEVLCRIRAITICGSDPGIIRGDLAGYWPPSYPFIPGHEWSGEVVALGPEVTGFRVGDRVAGEAHKGCGFCSRCLEGRYNLCKNYLKPETGHRHYGFTNQGAYAQYNAYSVKAIDHLPDTISFRVGALMDTVGIVAHAMELTGITIGGSVVVIGPGPIGLIAMRLARTLGAAKIIAVGRSPRLALAESSADHLVDFETTDPVQAVRELTGDLGVSEAFECSGAAGTFNQAVRMVQRGGRIGLLGVPPKDVVEELPFAYIVANEIAIFGSKANPHIAERIINLSSTGQLPLDDLVTHSFPLEEFATALDTFLSRRDGAMKVAVEPNGAES